MEPTRTAAVLVCIASLFAVSASATPLNVKTGLWESTFTSQMSGELPLAASNLSPQQQAQLRAMLKARQAQGQHTKVYKSCLTRKQLEEDPAAEPPESGESCTTRIAVKTSRHWKGTRVCTRGSRRREFDIDLRAVSRERTRGTVRVVFSEDGQTMTVNGRLAGRWLSSNCGSVK